MMGTWRQVGLLLWKNWLVQKRQLIWSTMEIILPLLFTAIIVILRQQVISSDEPSGQYSPFQLDGSFSDLVRPVPGGSRMLSECNFFGEQLLTSLNFSHPSRVQLYFSPNTSDAVQVMETLKSRFEFLPTLNGAVSPFPFNLVDVRGFVDETSMVNALLSDYDSSPNYTCSNPYWGGIAFSNGLNISDASSLDYIIRLPNLRRNKQSRTKQGSMGSVDEGWDTKLKFPVVRQPGPRKANATTGGKPGYYREGFLTLQRAIDASFIHAINPTFYNTHLTPQSVIVNLTNAFDPSHPSQIPTFSNITYDFQNTNDWTFEMKRFSYAQYFKNPFVAVVQRQLTVILMLSLALSVLYITRTVVQEKEKRLKEYMRVMGLEGWVHWVSHFITNWIKLALSLTVVGILLVVSFSGKRVLDHADVSLVIVFLWVYAAATVWFAFAVSTFFKGGNTASACAGVLWFLSYLPFFFLQPRYPQLSLSEKLLSSLSLNTGVAYGGYVIGIFEGTGAGIQWSTLFSPGTVDDNLSLGHVFAMMFVNIFILMFITWYVEAVNPGDEGVPQKWYFPFQISYWRTNRSSSMTVSKNVFETPISTISGAYEEYPKDAKPQVTLHNLSKTFGSGKKEVRAVSNLCLQMYPGQVTALLGHNGAGKSTTVSMLTGLIPPSGGCATIAGLDVERDLGSVRKFLGLCPQYNTLFDNLTVVEHLQLFCKLKNRLYMETEVTRLLKALDMDKKRDAMSKTLSGGMKRKLSVAIALIGGSEVVLLDEPTSGMDPGARHEAWTLVQKEKEYRTIVLTTHYMEEADLLADRIAILAKGKLQCCGSGLFLKQHYGAGYHVTVLLEKTTSGANSRTLANRILDIMRKHCASAQLQTCVGCEATFLLSSKDKERFGELFSELEEKQNELHVNSFGVSVSTMEEVFLKVGSLAESPSSSSVHSNNEVLPLEERVSDELATSVASKSSNGEEIIGMRSLQGDDVTFDLSVLELQLDNPIPLFNVSDFQCNNRLSGLQLQISQLGGMLVKRILHSMRNWLVLVAQLIIPVFCVLSAILINKLLPGPQPVPALAISLSSFSPSLIATMLNSSSGFETSFTREYIRLLNATANANIVPLIDRGSFDDAIIELYGKLGKNTVDAHYPIGLQTQIGNVIAYFNDQPYHTPPIALNLVDTALLRLASNVSGATVRTVNHPLPPSHKDKLTDWLATGVAEFNIAFNLLFGMAFLSSSFVVFLVKERVGKAKHLQFLSGVDPVNFWLATFAWDLLNYLLPCACLLGLFFAFDDNLVVGEGRWMHILLLLVLYGWSVLPLMYIASFVFDTPAGAFVKLTIFNILSGMVTLTVIVVIFMLDLPDVYDKLQWTFEVLFPNFNLGFGFNTFYMNQYIRGSCQPFKDLCGNPKLEVQFCCNGGGFTEYPLSWDSPGIGRMLFFLFMQGVAYWTVVMVIEFDWIRYVTYAVKMGTKAVRERQSKYGTLDDRNTVNNQYLQRDEVVLESGEDIDNDVRQEALNVNNLSHWDAPLIVKNLTKYYSNFKAVNGVNFSVRPGECFGLLGVNGAGKTSTFQMLTGEQIISDGDAHISGNSVRASWRKAGRQVGYCPQFDAVIDQMTGMETVCMYARLRGVPPGHVNRVAHAVIDAVGINKYMHRQAKTYSGGNKRRLSLAIALIGGPTVLLLDEPTTGVDPIARRVIWNVLAQARQQGTAIVLTSHSMEECEALCSRLAIMVAGNFKCLATTQRLKTKYGLGYSMQLRTRHMDDVTKAASAISSAFPTSVLKEVHETHLSYELPSGKETWSQLFSTIQSLADSCNLVDYSLSQTTLEQIFLSFSNQSNRTTSLNVYDIL